MASKNFRYEHKDDKLKIFPDEMVCCGLINPISDFTEEFKAEKIIISAPGFSELAKNILTKRGWTCIGCEKN